MMTKSNPKQGPCKLTQVAAHILPPVSLLNAVTDAPFPTVTDVYEEFVLAEPGQTFKVLVSVQRSTIPWPEDSTHLCVIGVLEERWFLHGKVIRRQDLAEADDEESEVLVTLDGLVEPGISYSDRHGLCFEQTAVQLQQTDPTSWTSQAGLVKVVVAVGKLLQQTQSRKEHSATEPAKVICGGECKPFNLPALRVVPSVAVHHSKATPKTQNSQQAIIAGVAKITESATVMPWPAGHILIDEHDADIDEQDMLNSVALDSITVKYDSEEHVKLRLEHSEQTLADNNEFAGQPWKRPRRNAKLNGHGPTNNSYKEVCTLGTSIFMTCICTYAHPKSCILASKRSIYTCHSDDNVLRTCRCLLLWTSQVLKSIETCTCLALSV